MKKIIYSLGIIGLMTPFGIKALTGDVTITCTKNKLSKEETTTCAVKGNITEEVSAVSAKVDLGDNLTFIGFTPDSSWQGDGEEGNIELYTETNKSGNFNIGTITVKAGNTSGVSTSVGLREVKLTDASFTESDMTVEPFSIRIPSEVNTLSDLKIGSETINGFSPNKTDYEIDVLAITQKVTINATATDTTSTITGDTGEKTLSYGENNFKITVTSEAGIAKEYNIKITRPESRELTSLKINDKEIELEKGTYEYTIKVENNITEAEIDAKYFTNGFVSFVDNFGSRTVSNLKVGKNEVLIKVKDIDDNELVYKININRLDEKGNDVTSTKVENPKTGVYSFSIALVAACIVGYAVAKKKSLFKKKI